MNIVEILLVLSLCETVFSQLHLHKGAPHVRLQNGILRGKMENSRQGRTYSSFIGIQYGKIRERFQPPESLSNESWTDVKPALESGSRCPQLNFLTGEYLGEEDCLYLNVHIPWKYVKENLPVMVYIHGGGYLDGGGDNYGAKYFMDEDVVFVTINYRLGALGFLSTGDEVVTGNMGMKDQVMALKWVQDNIRAFGGDPHRVTIFGESAGGSSVHLHMMSPMAKGLFHRAILQSGAGSCPWALKPSELVLQDTKRLGELLKCPTDSSVELINCLKQSEAKDVIQAQTKFKKWNNDPIVTFAPIVETALPGKSQFLPDTPSSLVKQNNYNKVPIIAGINGDEGLVIHSVAIMSNEVLVNDLNENWNTIAPITFMYENLFSNEDLNSVSEKVKTFYFDGKPVSQLTFQNLTNLYSDVVFVNGIINDVLLLAKEVDTYLYILKFIGEFSCSSYFGTTEIFGTAHGDDLQYFFNMKAYSSEVEYSVNSPSGQFSQNIVKLWASFAETGKPTKTWGSVERWNPISKEEAAGIKPLKFLELNSNLSIVNSPFKERIELWNSIFKEHRKSSFIRDEF